MEKIYNICISQGKYTVPIHELLRSVIFSDNIHYSSSTSEIVNLLDVRYHNPNEHFILSVLVALLDDYSKNSRNDGFVTIKEVYSYMQGVGFDPRQIDSVLNFAYSKKLFETSQKGDKLLTQNNELNIRATNLAIYHLRFLLNSFTYIDAIVVDTPVFDPEFRDKIVNTMQISSRLERAEIFRNYLDEQWKISNLKTNHFTWPNLSKELEMDINNIKRRIEEKEQQ